MGLSDRDFASVYEVVDKAVGGPKDSSMTGKVIKRDPDNKLVWIAELGDQPIPLVGLDYEVKYYDTTTGGVVEKAAKIEPIVPHIGDIVFVILERGTRRLPRCVGKIQSRNYISTSSDEA